MVATLDLVKQLMACKPVSSDIPAVNRAVTVLKRYLDGQGVYTRVERRGTRMILYAATRRTRTPRWLFNAHLDVVPAGDDRLFCMRRRSGWIWGRGTGDCLGNCAVLARVLVACKGQADAGVVFSTDEEIGGDTTGDMVRRGYRGRLVIVMDASTRTGSDLAVAQKGILTLKLIARGRACHGASPWLGVNAVDRLVDGYLRVRTLFPLVRSGDEWHPTMSANIVRAGSVANRVPDEAELVLDIRFTERERPARLLALVRRVSGLKVERLHQCPVVFCDARHPLLRAFAAHMSAALGRPTRITRMNGATDARHFAALKAPIAMIAVPHADVHSGTERAYVRGMLQVERMLVAWCLREHEQGGTR